MSQDNNKKSRRQNIYGSIFTLKVSQLCIALGLTILLFLLDVIEAIKHGSLDNINPSRPSSYVIIIIIVFFVISIFLDLYILKRTMAIGNRLNELAYIDKLTGLPNRYSCDLLFESFNSDNKLQNAGIIVMKINNLGKVNSSSGHQGGNWLISEFCTILEEVGENYGYVGRNGGNEFITLLEDCDSTKADMFLLDLTKRIQGYNELNVGAPIEVAYSRVLNSDANVDIVSKLVSLGYRKLLESPQILS
ncbi:GGDEF domain-containing protein [Butyrivibrio proteoclasticus]|uniref:GGDEF domain-containing protein n=1 Tax=Butyrivibrio proteoclasticus TaxID=43305 RepID=UPI00047B97D7|nr:GGDEF domain-containing protein [Butyrivibrio proteoclasticus]